MRRRLAAACGMLLAVAGLVGCGTDSVAGKTTTTGNGGGLVAMGPDGRPASGCLVLAARSWDPVRGAPGTVDTLRSDSDGRVELPQEAYAFVEVRDETRGLGAWMRRVSVSEGSFERLSLDTLRGVRGRWSSGGVAAEGRMYLDSSFQSSALGSDGGFAFAQVPAGTWALRQSSGIGPSRELGALRVDSGKARSLGDGSVTVLVDSTAAPQWIDDFEAGSNIPRLHGSLPSVSPWYMWWVETNMTLPSSNDESSIVKAIGTDEARAGRSFHARFAPQGTSSWVALGLTGLELDWSGREGLCFGYRSDTVLKIQLQRDSVGAVRPTVSAWVPVSRAWRDVCVPFAAFVPNGDVPDSLKTWASFGKRILVVEFQTAGGTSLDLDDILVR